VTGSSRRLAGDSGRRPGRSRRRRQAGRKQPVPQLGEAEQPHQERDPADPATTHDHPLAHDPAGQELEPVPVHQQVTVALHDHGRLQGADNPVAVLHLQGKASSWLEGAGTSARTWRLPASLK
jgi:hypothetical protein